MNPWDKTGTAIGIAVAVMIVGSLLGFSTAWVPGVLGAILPGMVLSAVAAALAGAVTRQMPPALAVGGVTFVLTVAFRVILWTSTH